MMQKKHLMMGLMGLVMISAYSGFYVAQNQSRGIRNKNPGNLRYNGIQWDGLVGEDDAGFCVFRQHLWGLRAMARVLMNYQDRHGINTIRGVVERWAPDTENETQAYVDHVASDLGVDPDQPIVIKTILPRLMVQLIEHENGEQPYSKALIIDAIEAAA